MKTRTKKLTAAAVLSALALISFMLESLFPPLFIPGARLGISNVFILCAVIYLGVYYGYAAFMIKAVLGSVFTGNISSLLYSLPAGLIALTVEVLLLLFTKRLTVISVSVAGGAIHLLIQNLVFCLVAGGTEYLVYLPYLTVIGAVSGAFVGFAVFLLIKYLPDSLIGKSEKREDKL